MKAIILGLSILATQAFAIECGDTIYNQEVELTSDLDCSSMSGFAALELKGTSKLKGHGFKVISPNTSVVIYAEGSEVKVKNTIIEGSESNIGIQGYNVGKLVVKKVTANNMRIGVDYYAEENFSCTRLRIVESDLSSNNLGAKVYSPNCEKFPLIKETNLSNSADRALYIEANRVRITGNHNNNFSNSANGMSLKGTDKVVLKELDLANSSIDGTQAFIYDSGVVKLRDSKFGNSAGTAVDMYEVDEVIVNRSEFVASGVGLKVASDSVSTSLTVKNSDSSSNITAGVLAVSYGAVKFANIDTTENNSLDYVSIQNQ